MSVGDAEGRVRRRNLAERRAISRGRGSTYHSTLPVGVRPDTTMVYALGAPGDWRGYVAIEPDGHVYKSSDAALVDVEAFLAALVIKDKP